MELWSGPAVLGKSDRPGMKGVRGWTNEPQKFANKDACGAPAPKNPPEDPAFKKLVS